MTTASVGFGTNRHHLRRCSARPFFAAAVDVAHRRANLGIAVAVDVFEQKVDQAAFALKQRQKLHRPALTNRIALGSRKRRWRDSGRRLGLGSDRSGSGGFSGGATGCFTGSLAGRAGAGFGKAPPHRSASVC